MLTVPAILNATEQDRAIGHLREYFGLDNVPALTGASFESLGGGGDNASTANVITAEDIVAVSMLAIRIHGRAALRILEDTDFANTVTDCLTQIPTDVDMAEADREVWGPDSPADRLWTHLRQLHRVGPTTTSKLMARKRPRLIPVYDSVVKRAFGLPHAGPQWDQWHELFSADDGRLHKAMIELRKSADLPDHISPLRVMDVVVWMEYRTSGEDDDTDTSTSEED